MQQDKLAGRGIHPFLFFFCFFFGPKYPQTRFVLYKALHLSSTFGCPLCMMYSGSGSSLGSMSAPDWRNDSVCKPGLQRLHRLRNAAVTRGRLHHKDILLENEFLLRFTAENKNQCSQRGRLGKVCVALLSYETGW